MEAERLGQQLKNQTELSTEDIRQKTQQKIEKYNGLVTKKDAAVILVARDHNIDLIELNKPELEIQNIEQDMQEVNLKAKVHNIDKFSYQKNGETKKACDITLRDDTGKISLMLWGKEQVELIEGLKVNDDIEIQGAYSNEYQGEVQLGWSDNTTLDLI